MVANPDQGFPPTRANEHLTLIGDCGALGSVVLGQTFTPLSDAKPRAPQFLSLFSVRSPPGVRCCCAEKRLLVPCRLPLLRAKCASSRSCGAS